MRPGIVAFGLFIVGLAVPIIGQSAVLTWVGGSGSDWKNIANWSGGTTYPGELNNQDVAIINLNGANVSLSGGLTYNPQSIQVTSAGTASLAITNGSVATTATPTNQSVLVSGAAGSSNTLRIEQGGALAVSTGSGKLLQIGSRNINATLSLVHVDGGSLTSGRVGFWGTGGSELRVSGAATLSLGTIETDNNGGSKYGKLEFIGSQHTSSAISLETGFDGAINTSFNLLFTADAGGVKPLSLSGNLTLRDDAVSNRRTHLTLDLSAYTLPEDPTQNIDFTLISYGGSLDGVFSSVTVLGGNLVGVNYAGGDLGNQIILTVNSAVPEPSTAALMLLGLAGIARWRARGR